MPRKKSNSTGRSSSRKAVKRKIAPEDLKRVESVADPQISPGGTCVLFSKHHIGDKNKRVTNLWIVPTETGKPRQFTSGGKDAHGRWSPDGETIAFISGRDKPKPNIYTLSAAGGEATPLSQFPEGTIGGFRWSPDGTMLAVSFRETEPEWTEEAKKIREENGQSVPPRVIDDIYYRLDGDGYFNARRFALYIVDVINGKHRLLFDRDTLGFFRFDWSPDSTQLVVATNTSPNAMLNPWKDELYRVNVKTGKAHKIPNLPLGEKMAVCWSPDGKKIAYAGREGKEGWGVTNLCMFVCDPQKGNAQNLTGNEDYCLEAKTISDTAEIDFEPSICWSRNSRRIFMNLGWHGETHIASIDRNGGEIVFHTKGRQTVLMGNFSDNGRNIALLCSNQTTLPEIAIGSFDKAATEKSLEVTKRTQFNKRLLDELQLSKAEPHWIRSEDGNKIHLWIMKPIDFKPTKKYPAVFMVHGGPHCQYGEVFFHEFQVMAAAGYVVVYCNPRGSKGYGQEHCIAIKGNWGADDWTDIEAVTAFMKKHETIKAKKMGIAGGSYGGYMTNWAIGHTNDFAAAATDRCVSNLVSMAGSSDFPVVPGQYWEGNSWDDIENLWNQSPLKYFGNVETPTLIIHSEGDLRCNVEQSEQIFTVLKIRGIPTRFVRYPSTTSHGMSRNGPTDLRIHRLKQYLDWWKQYLS